MRPRGPAAARASFLHLLLSLRDVGCLQRPLAQATRPGENSARSTSLPHLGESSTGLSCARRGAFAATVGRACGLGPRRPDQRTRVRLRQQLRALVVPALPHPHRQNARGPICIRRSSWQMGQTSPFIHDASFHRTRRVNLCLSESIHLKRGPSAAITCTRATIRLCL